MSRSHPDPEPRSPSLSRNVLFDMGSTVGYLVTRFFIPPFVLAHVGLAAYGLWATVFVLVAYLGISTIGVSNVYVKYVAENLGKGTPERANPILATGLYATFALSSVLFVVTCLLWPVLATWLEVPVAFRDEARHVVLMVVFAFLLDLALSVFRDALNGAQRIATTRTIWTFSYLLETALVVLLVSSGRGLVGLAEAFLARSVFAIVTSYVVARRTLPWMRVHPTLIGRDAVKTLLSFGGVVQLQAFLSIALNSIERVIAAPLLGLPVAGLYDLAKKLPSMASMLPHAFTSSLVPAASFTDSTGNGDERLRTIYVKAARYMAFLTALTCGFLATLAGPVTFVWLGEHLEHVPLLTALFALGIQWHMSTGASTAMFKGMGRLREEFHYLLPSFAGMALLLPVSRLVFGEWSILGVAAALSLATIAAASYFLRRANRLFGMEPARYRREVALPALLPYMVGAVLSLATMPYLNGLARWPLALNLLWIGFVHVLVSCLAFARLCATDEERTRFAAMRLKLVARLPGWRSISTR